MHAEVWDVKHACFLATSAAGCTTWTTLQPIGYVAMYVILYVYVGDLIWDIIQSIAIASYYSFRMHSYM